DAAPGTGHHDDSAVTDSWHENPPSRERSRTVRESTSRSTDRSPIIDDATATRIALTRRATQLGEGRGADQTAAAARGAIPSALPLPDEIYSGRGPPRASDRRPTRATARQGKGRHHHVGISTVERAGEEIER